GHGVGGGEGVVRGGVERGGEERGERRAHVGGEQRLVGEVDLVVRRFGRAAVAPLRQAARRHLEQRHRGGEPLGRGVVLAAVVAAERRIEVGARADLRLRQRRRRQGGGGQHEGAPAAGAGADAEVFRPDVAGEGAF